ncbi:hypothetical protein BDV09DRAFT_173025 [Aspergillus tetrazonus]
MALQCPCRNCWLVLSSLLPRWAPVIAVPALAMLVGFLKVTGDCYPRCLMKSVSSAALTGCYLYPDYSIF